MPDVGVYIVDEVAVDFITDLYAKVRSAILIVSRGGSCQQADLGSLVSVMSSCNTRSVDEATVYVGLTFDLLDPPYSDVCSS